MKKYFGLISLIAYIQIKVRKLIVHNYFLSMYYVLGTILDAEGIVVCYKTSSLLSMSLQATWQPVPQINGASRLAQP